MVSITIICALLTAASAATNTTTMSNFIWPPQHNGTAMHVSHYNITKRLEAVLNPQQVKSNTTHAATTLAIAITGAAISAIAACTIAYIYFQRRSSKKTNAKKKMDVEASAESFNAQQPASCDVSSICTLRVEQPLGGGDLGAAGRDGPGETGTTHYTHACESGLSRLDEVDLADVPDVQRTEVR
ncbi:uncharacterized protein K460DRAFT_400573 [Cucurbitaria berberidis CBS 394.84]|uniref:Mid2 domain-containing protein n=1 Tax=Cucurbitaria berberidis CBS 394.84 TaxID=1168544 RepID=A0A9P4GT00_9PLEO|nr:uncharacterized protein K460DRAFT_400573 [Cucurbitaria berberidis CBS 394.84]KAF1850511.1 hypothetical protein K460DRAFT_400573 [Cucurbitaria berberidis CBS 394.84]